MRSPAVRPSLLPLAYFLLCVGCQVLFVAGLTVLIPRLTRSVAFDFLNALGMLLGIWIAIRFAGAPPIRFNRPRKCLSAWVLALGGGLLLSLLDLKVMGALDTPALAGNFATIRASLQSHDYARVGLLVLPVCLLYPILEEGLFRGMLLAAFLRARRSQATSVALASALFALMHLTSGLEIVPVLEIFLLGLVLSWLSIRHASLVPAVVLHAAFNTLAVVVQARLS